MPDLWLALAPAYCIGLLTATIAEIAITPRPRFLQRTIIAWQIHLGVWTLLFAAELLLWQRPWFAAANGFALMLLLVVISNVKQQLMREPFVFMDFEYFTDLLRHPRLYLPFFGIGRTVILLGLFFFAVYLALMLENSLIQELGWHNFIISVAVLLLLAGALLKRNAPAMSFSANADLKQHGFLTCIWAYALAERKPAHFVGKEWKALADALPTGAAAPHMVLVQSESFFDARPVHESVNSDVYAWWDELRKASWIHGNLDVPARGANTVRTEFAVLSGLSEAEQGVYRFNPYRKMDFSTLPTLPRAMKRAGYQTICIHPYSANFYRRNHVFPSLGFDEFIDIRAFTHAPRCGPYVSDVAVASMVKQLLETAKEPLFIFVITMENHGPLHYEQVMDADRARYHQTPPPAGLDDLTVYLRHIENAGKMCRELQAALTAADRPSRLCWYGDHVAIMPKVYAATEFDSGTTNYSIWHSDDNKHQPQQRKLQASELGLALLRSSV